MLLANILITLFFINISVAKGISNILGGACVNIYSNSLNKYPFICASDGISPVLTDLSNKCLCSNENYMLTVLGCIKQGANTDKESKEAIDYLVETCKNNNLILDTSKLEFFLTENYKFFTTLSYQIKEYKKYVTSMKAYNSFNGLKDNAEPFVLKYPIYTESSYLNDSIAEIDDIVFNRHLSSIMGIILNIFWIIIPIFGLIGNGIYWAFPTFVMKIKSKKICKKIRIFCLKSQIWHNQTDESKHVLKTASIQKSTNESNKYIEQAKTLESKNSFPNRMQFVTISFYSLINFCFCVSFYYTTPQKQSFFFKHIQAYNADIIEHNLNSRKAMLFVADRTGILAICQLPLVFLMAGQNNLLITLTGWDYKTFNFFHKWIARLCVFLIGVHAVTYFNFAFNNGTFKYRWTLEKWRCACLGFFSIIVLILGTIRRFRIIFYETFKIIHQVFSILFCFGVYYHIKKLGWNEFLYVSLIFWASEYLFRFSKIIVSGGVIQAKCVGIFDPKGSKQKKCHTIKLYISHSKWWRPYPGCFVFVYILTPGLFWQRHPITVLQDADDPSNTDIVLLIKVKNGMTKRLADIVSASPDGHCTIPILLEGPYGSSISLKRYTNSLFFAGGIGFTAVYSLAIDSAKEILSQLRSGERKSDYLNIDSNDDIENTEIKEDSRENKNSPIIVNWFIPHLQSLEIFINEVMYLSQFGASLVNINIYITRWDLTDTSYLQLASQATTIKEREMDNDIKPENTSVKRNFSGFSSVLTDEVLPSGYTDYWDEKSVYKPSRAATVNSQLLTDDSEQNNETTYYTDIAGSDLKNGLLSLNKEDLIDSSPPKATIISNPSSDSSFKKKEKQIDIIGVTDTRSTIKLESSNEGSDDVNLEIGENTDNNTENIQSSKETEKTDEKLSESTSDSSKDFVVKTDTKIYSINSAKEKFYLEQKLRQAQIKNHLEKEAQEELAKQQNNNNNNNNKWSLSSINSIFSGKKANSKKLKEKDPGVLSFEKSINYRLCKINEVMQQKYSNIHVTANRLPNLLSMVEKEIEQCSGSVAIVSCGPSSMKSDIRKSFLAALAKDELKLFLDFFEEELVW
ncbi:hypothetical protein ACO0SA_004258 [Hanseniaspora valbyensis]